jgi:hypothetical protein
MVRCLALLTPPNRVEGVFSEVRLTEFSEVRIAPVQPLALPTQSICYTCYITG